MMKIVLAAWAVIAVAASAVPGDYEQTRRASKDVKLVFHSDGPDKMEDAPLAWVLPGRDPYVINGTPVSDIDEFPQVATLVIAQRNLVEQNNAIQCTASVIDDYVVLTAAHCVQSNLASWETYAVCAGTVDMTNDVSDRVCAEAESIWVPTAYDDDQFWLGYDIAVIKVKSPLLTNTILRAKVNFNKPTNGLKGFIVGFGYTVANAGVDNKMYYTDALIRLNEGQCNYLSGSFSQGNSKLICGHGAGGNSGSCNGDSGGPLLVKKRRAKNYVVVGVLSYGEQNCRTNSEGVYASLYDTSHKRLFKQMVRRAGGTWKRGRLPTSN